MLVRRWHGANQRSNRQEATMSTCWVRYYPVMAAILVLQNMSRRAILSPCSLWLWNIVRLYWPLSRFEYSLSILKMSRVQVLIYSIYHFADIKVIILFVFTGFLCGESVYMVDSPHSYSNMEMILMRSYWRVSSCWVLLIYADQTTSSQWPQMSWCQMAPRLQQTPCRLDYDYTVT